ncbi:MAG TPA: pilus assembly protein TadG-related protein [Vicinamibacterales bacterium]|nr:pilus assembly protein TadG-related protein [Vicinamibacterales bacterium]
MRRRPFNVRDERGMVLILVGASFLALMSAAMLAIDVGMFMVARTESQKSADSGALAGAVALVFDNYDDRTPTGPAVQNAIAAATSTQNAVVNAQVSVIPADVTFPATDRISVRVQRSTARGNPLLTLLAPMIGINSVDIGAVATAKVSPADAATCLKPWAIPDKWDERHTPQWDPSDTLEMFYENGPNKGKPLPNPDRYTHYEPNPNAYTGFRSSRQGPDYGTQMVLKPGSPSGAINPSQFFPIRLPGGTGASYYESNISGCWPGEAEVGDSITVEPGSMTGPTTSGVQDLIDRDPNAFWDTAKREVVSQIRPSPRIIVIPVFDPYVYESARQTGATDIKIANFVGFFLEGLQGNTVTGRMVPMTGLISNNGGGPAPTGAFLQAIQLVE